MNKPPNAYILYRKKFYHEVKNNNPNLSFSELSKLLSKQWHELNKKEKDEYYNESYILKQKYEENKNMNKI